MIIKYIESKFNFKTKIIDCVITGYDSPNSLLVKIIFEDPLGEKIMSIERNDYIRWLHIKKIKLL